MLEDPALPNGAYVAVIGIKTNTHRVTRVMEDAGFEIRPAIVHLRSGKPPLVIPVGRTPGSVVLPFDIEGCRIAPTGEHRSREHEPSKDRRYGALERNLGAGFQKPGARGGDVNGRWPTDAVLCEEARQSLREKSRFFTSADDPVELERWLSKLLAPSGGRIVHAAQPYDSEVALIATGVKVVRPSKRADEVETTRPDVAPLSALVMYEA